MVSQKPIIETKKFLLVGEFNKESMAVTNELFSKRRSGWANEEIVGLEFGIYGQ